MIKEIKLPEISENVEHGDVIKVLVKVGDNITKDQSIIELETDKATFEVPSTEEGIIKEILIKEGDVIDIGAVIIKVETNSKNGSSESENNDNSNKENGNKEKDNDDEGKADEKVKESESSETDDESKKIKSSDKESSDKESSDKESSDKESSDKESSDKESSDKESSDKESSDKESSDKESSDKESSDKEEIVRSGDNINLLEKIKNKDLAPASPSVRRLARELGVEVGDVTGTGISGRISEDDIKLYVKSLMKESGSISITSKALPDFSKWGEISKEPMSKVRSITAESMTYAWTTPMVTQFDKADITLMEEFRKKYAKAVESKGGNLTITSLLVKICTEALKKFPQFNSSIDVNKKEIIYKKYYNVGIAVDTDRGLLVPVIRNTDKKNITEISVEMNDLAEKARTKKITPDEMNGGNFTISNLGGIGGTAFTPIVYSPQVAILGVSRASREAVFINENFEPRMMLPLMLTYDHRIIDGADAARFLRWVCQALENPMTILL